MFKNKDKKEKGFTLIELLVVISIISLLSSVVLASLQDSRNKAKFATTKEMFLQVRNQMELYYSAHGNYGTDDTGITYGFFHPTSYSTYNNGLFDTEDDMKNILNGITDKTGNDFIAYGYNKNSWAVATSVAKIVTIEIINTVYAIPLGNDLIGPNGNYICIDSSGNLVESTTSSPNLSDITEVVNGKIQCK